MGPGLPGQPFPTKSFLIYSSSTKNFYSLFFLYTLLKFCNIYVQPYGLYSNPVFRFDSQP